MKRVGTKNSFKQFLGSKNINRGVKIGAKYLGLVGDLAPVAAVTPGLQAAAPILEAAKVASIGLEGGRIAAKMLKRK